MAAAACVASLPSHGQSASQITPRTFAPATEESPGGVSIAPATGVETPPGAEKLKVELSGVVISGGFSLVPETEAKIRAELADKWVTGAQIFAAARELEAAYARAGYVLVRVVVPPQKLDYGAYLRLTVIDGYIERIETNNVPKRVRQRIDAMVGPLTGRHGLKLSEIERRILLASDTPGVILRSTLAPGSETGATILVIDADYQAVSGVVAADNSLAASLGGFELTLGIDFNSVLGFGELLYLRATGDPNDGPNGFTSSHPRNRTLAAGVIVPIGNDGLTFNVEGTLAQTTPDETDNLQSTDVFDRLSLRLRYPWLRTRNINASSQLSFDVQDEREDLVVPSSVELFQDRLRILRLMQDGNYLSPWGGAFSASVTGSLGLDTLGARSAADATSAIPLSRQGADATFTKMEGGLGYTQTLAKHLVTTWTARGQYSFGSALARSEQIGIVDPVSLSGFNAGTLQGDSGVVLRAEFSSPFVLPTGSDKLGIVASPYIFGAGGEIFLNDPTALEDSDVRAASVGVGVRLAGGAQGSLSNGSAGFEFAEDFRSDNQPNGNRLNVSLSLRF
jgi:hemolysin activation/secretion protein